MLTITPFLWFDTQAEEAMNYYATVFPHAKVLSVSRAGERVMSVEFELEGQRFMGLNGGPHYKMNEAVSFFVSCETQGEVDELWNELTSDGGKPNRCGWLTDKFGVTWQIIPKSLGRLLSGGGDAARGKRVLDAMLKMGKLDVATLQAAYDAA